MEIACWCHLRRDFDGDDAQAKKRINQASEGGINILLPFVHDSKNQAWYRSGLDYAGQEDRLARVLALAKEKGMEVHPVVIPISGLGLSEQERARRSYTPGDCKEESRMRQLCASWEESRETGLCIAMDIMDNYDVDGIHFDYMRYGDTGCSLERPCLCEACRTRYRELIGKDELTADDLKVPGILHKFLEFRGENIRGLAERLSTAVRSRGLKVSMAARPHFLGTPLPLPAEILARYFGSSLPEKQDWGKWSSLVEGQDWVKWAREGLMDFICPMNYSTDREFHRMRLAEQISLTAKSVPIYDGIGRKSSVGEISPEEMVRQAEDSISLGAAGITIFHFNALGEDDFRELARFREANT